MGYRIHGDPEKIIASVEEELVNKLEKAAEAVESEATKLLSQLLGKRIGELLRRIEDAEKNYVNALESARSKAEVELKKMGERRKEEWILRAVEEVKSSFIRRVLEDEGLYRSYLERSLRDVLSSEERILVQADERTARIIEEISRSAGFGERVRIESLDLKSSGGFVALSGDGGVRYNYTLDHVISSREYELKVKVSKTLFG